MPMKGRGGKYQSLSKISVNKSTNVVWSSHHLSILSYHCDAGKGVDHMYNQNKGYGSKTGPNQDRETFISVREARLTFKNFPLFKEILSHKDMILLK